MESNLQLSSSDSSIQFEVWSQLGKEKLCERQHTGFSWFLGLFSSKKISPLLHDETLAIVAGELPLRAGGQLDQPHRPGPDVTPTLRDLV